MKTNITAALVAIAALYATQTNAQDAGDTDGSTAQESEMYLEEIKRTCQAEADGLPDAEAYISECIKNMKQSFSGSQE